MSEQAEIIYIDAANPFDSEKGVGGGRTAVVLSAMRVLGGRVAIVGFSDEERDVGRWNEIRIGTTTGRFFAVCRRRDLESRFGSANGQFAKYLARYWRHLVPASSFPVITRTYTVMWLACLRFRHGNLIYYAPGLASPAQVSRKPVLARVASPLYELLNFASLSRVKDFAAAADQPAVDAYNRYLASFGMKQRCRSVPTSVDCEFFSHCRSKEQCRESFGISRDAKVFISVCRLGREKRIDLALRSFAHVARRNPASLYLIVGDGEHRSPIERLISELSLQDQVRMVGQKGRAEVRDYLCSADVAVVASSVEGFSNSMLEYLACGLAIVTSRVSGADDIVEAGVNGFVVDPLTELDFADSMLKALSLERAGSESRRIAECRFGDERLWRSLLGRWL